MNKKVRRRLFNSTTYSFLLFAAGVVMLAFVAEGFSLAWREAQPKPAASETAVAVAEEAAPPPTRYVPPAEVEYPFF